MSELQWESWEELDNLPQDRKKDLILWMLTTQDDLVAAVEQENQQEIQMKKMESEIEELKKTLKNTRSQATREKNKLLKEIEALKDGEEAPEGEAPPVETPTVKKTRKARTVKTAPAAAPPAAPAEGEEDHRTLDQIPVNEQMRARKHASEMTMERLQHAVNDPEMTPWHRQIAEQELQQREVPEEIPTATPVPAPAAPTSAPAPAAPTPVPTNGATQMGDTKQKILGMMQPGARHSFNDLMNAATQAGIPEDEFVGAITNLQTEKVIDFPEAEIVTRLQ